MSVHCVLVWHMAFWLEAFCIRAWNHSLIIGAGVQRMEFGDIILDILMFGNSHMESFYLVHVSLVWMQIVLICIGALH